MKTRVRIRKSIKIAKLLEKADRLEKQGDNYEAEVLRKRARVIQGDIEGRINN
jgi:hypothetical protein